MKAKSSPAAKALDTATIPIVEEHLRVEKREVAKGLVRVETVTDTIATVVEEALRDETAEVTRVPINKVVSEAPRIRFEDSVTIIPIVEEVLVVEKQLRLKEEVHVRKHISTRNVQVPVSLRKERAVVTRHPK